MQPTTEDHGSCPSSIEHNTDGEPRKPALVPSHAVSRSGGWPHMPVAAGPNTWFGPHDDRVVCVLPFSRRRGSFTTPI